MNGRVLGLDPGTRRIGVALSDPTATIASPLLYVDAGAGAVSELARLCAENEAVVVVVGLPVSLDGTEGPSAVASRELGKAVADATGLPVEFQDERFTSHTAESALIEGKVRRTQRKEKRDQVAAAVMLQAWLDRTRQSNG